MPKLVTNCSQLVTCRQGDSTLKVGESLRSLEWIQNGAMVIEDDKIAWVGSGEEIGGKFPKEKFD